MKKQLTEEDKIRIRSIKYGKKWDRRDKVKKVRKRIVRIFKRKNKK
jgi:hypothetical protein